MLCCVIFSFFQDKNNWTKRKAFKFDDWLNRGKRYKPANHTAEILFFAIYFFREILNRMTFIDLLGEMFPKNWLWIFIPFIFFSFFLLSFVSFASFSVLFFSFFVLLCVEKNRPSVLIEKSKISTGTILLQVRQPTKADEQEQVKSDRIANNPKSNGEIFLRRFVLLTSFHSYSLEFSSSQIISLLCSTL